MANKSSWVKLRVTSDEKMMIEQKANSAGLSTSKFIRNMANDAKVYEKYDRLISGQLKRIEQSAIELRDLVNSKGWNKVILPRPGCMNGELDWEHVHPILEKYLGDEFYCITY